MRDQPDGLSDAGLWFRVEAAGSVGAVRRAAERVAEDLGMSGERRAVLAIAASEVASNLVKHADQGVLVVRAARAGEDAGVELLALDSGPGMADVRRALGDGHSTAGTLGIGLGAVVRQASWWDLHSVPGRGTVLAVQLWPAAAPRPTWASAVVRPLDGEAVSGDGFAVRTVDGRRQVLVCDGLGHGPLAAAATHAAVAAFRTAGPLAPAALVEALHAALRPTRGAALAVAEIGDGVLRYAGLGNIGGLLLGPYTRRGLVSLPGIAGHQRRAVRQYDYPLDDVSTLLMHSDGVADRWRLADYPGLLDHSPQVVAATVLRDAAVRRDDACVLVARLREPW